MPEPASNTTFLGYHHPPLLPAARWLVRNFAKGSEADLHDVFICVQGGRAARHLLGLLVEECQRASLALTPPQIGTPLELIDAIVAPAAPRARSEATTANRLLAWCDALARAGNDVVRALIPHRDLLGRDLASQAPIARMLDDARHELVGHGMTLAEAAHALEHSAHDFPDTPRWRAIAKIEREYLATLEAQGLADAPAIRGDAVHSGDFDRATRVVLAAAPELPRLVRLALAKHPPEAVLVIADQSESARFDELGTVKPEAFRVTDLGHEHIHIADSPAGQAREVEAILRSLAPGTPADDVLIGAPDASVVPALQSALERRGVRLRDAAGTPLARTAPAHFLHAVGELLEARGSRELSALVRHPDVHDWINARLGGADPGATAPWLRQLDDLQNSRPSGTLGPSWAVDGLTHDGELGPLGASLSELLGPLLAPGGTNEHRPLDSQLAAALDALSRLYETVPVGEDGSPSDLSFRALRVIAGHAGELTGACRARDTPLVSAPESLRLLLAFAEGDHVPARADPGALELVGWLEIALDDAPVCIVTGLNEGSVPRVTPGGPLLPNSARRALGLEGNASTLGRDAYLLNVLLRCHQRVVLIAGRRGIGGDPLTPSRLLFTCDDGALPARVRLWSEPDAPPAQRIPATPHTTAPGFEPMPRVPHPAVTSMSVTSFRSYLSSPYGFFLERVLKLSEVGEPSPELRPDALGTLFHDAMKRFAQGTARDATDTDAIHESMLAGLDSALADLIGPSPPGIVRVQVAQLRERFRAVAEMQSAHRAQGWHILHAEWQPSSAPTLDTPRGPMILTGKIDRIDRHETRNALTILDFKSGEKARHPRETRQKSGRWLDLQLPLYRHLAAELWRAGAKPEILLGYIAVPSRPGDAALLLADWTAADLDSADAAARDVVARVLGGEFFELGDGPPDSGSLGMICGEGLIRQDDDGDAEEGDE